MLTDGRKIGQAGAIKMKESQIEGSYGKELRSQYLGQ